MSNTDKLNPADTGGRARGSKHGHARLDENDVHQIKRRLQEGERVTEIARDYDVSNGCISAINTGRSWGHLTEFLPVLIPLSVHLDLMEYRAELDCADEDRPTTSEIVTAALRAYLELGELS